jgi:hypothetical protein
MKTKSEIQKYQDKKQRLHPTHYGIKYGINQVGMTHKDLLFEIWKYEMKNLNAILKQPKDKYTGEYGYYIID